MRYPIILAMIFLSACGMNKGNIKPEQIATPEEVAKVKVKPNLELPPPLDLTEFKMNPTEVKQYEFNGKTYIAMPQEYMLNHSRLLLVLKTRILELQRLITDAKKSM
jgi:hypothetical protein